jgi:PAS domain S-box-containing protein
VAFSHQSSTSGRSVALRSVLSLDELRKRPTRAPEFAAECRGLLTLGEQLATAPDQVLQRLAETTMALCRAQSAGISLLEPDGRHFYWPAIAGEWAEKVGGGTPRDYGPCGTVLDSDSALLFSHPELDFDYYAPVKPVVEEALLVPFYVNGEAVGTVWAVMHDRSRLFDSEDLRLMTDLCAFAASTYRALNSLNKINAAAAVIDSSDDAIITKSLNSIITSWNAGAERLFGYSAEEIVGKPVTILMPPHVVDEEPGILDRIRRGQRIDHYETVRVRKDGTILNISLTVSPIKDSTGKIVGASKIARDITDRAQAEERIRALARETEHRTKNILANVYATVHMTEAETAQEFKKAVEGRIHALANVHRLFVESRWAGAELHRCVSEELAPYQDSSGLRVTIDGPEILLKPNAAQLFAVVCHELATNAAKYGALSVASGRVAVTWTIHDQRLDLKWTETGGPSVAVPTRRGFGTRVIGKMIAHGNGELRTDWRREGLSCEVVMPIDVAE